MFAIRPGPLGLVGFGLGLILSLGVLFLFAQATACKDRKTPTDGLPSNTQTLGIPVEGMSCVACAARVKKTLVSIAGVSDVQVSLSERRARIRFDPSRLGPERLVTAINGLGYHAGAPTEAR